MFKQDEMCVKGLLKQWYQQGNHVMLGNIIISCDFILKTKKQAFF